MSATTEANVPALPRANKKLIESSKRDGWRISKSPHFRAFAIVIAFLLGSAVLAWGMKGLFNNFIPDGQSKVELTSATKGIFEGWSNLSDMLSFIIGMPIALAGSAVAIWLAYLANSSARDTHELAERQQSLAEQQQVLERFQPISDMVDRSVDHFMKFALSIDRAERPLRRVTRKAIEYQGSDQDKKDIENALKDASIALHEIGDTLKVLWSDPIAREAIQTRKDRDSRDLVVSRYLQIFEDTVEAGHASKTSPPLWGAPSTLLELSRTFREAAEWAESPDLNELDARIKLFRYNLRLNGGTVSGSKIRYSKKSNEAFPCQDPIHTREGQEWYLHDCDDQEDASCIDFATRKEGEEYEEKLSPRVEIGHPQHAIEGWQDHRDVYNMYPSRGRLLLQTRAQRKLVFDEISAPSAASATSQLMFALGLLTSPVANPLPYPKFKIDDYTDRVHSDSPVGSSDGVCRCSECYKKHRLDESDQDASDRKKENPRSQLMGGPPISESQRKRMPEFMPRQRDRSDWEYLKLLNAYSEKMSLVRSKREEVNPSLRTRHLVLNGVEGRMRRTLSRMLEDVSRDTNLLNFGGLALLLLADTYPDADDLQRAVRKVITENEKTTINGEEGIEVFPTNEVSALVRKAEANLAQRSIPEFAPLWVEEVRNSEKSGKAITTDGRPYMGLDLLLTLPQAAKRSDHPKRIDRVSEFEIFRDSRPDE